MPFDRSMLFSTALIAALALAGCKCNPCPDANNPECAPVCLVSTVNILSPTEGTLFGADDDTTGGALLPDAIGVEVTAEALDSGGNPVPNVDVVLTASDGTVATRTTDANGVATFTDFPLAADAGSENVLTTLEARDADGCATDIGAVSLVSDIAPPLCVFTVPQDNATLDCGDDLDGMSLNGIQIDVTLSSDAGNNQTVQLTIDGDTANTQLGTLNAGSVSFVATLAPGAGATRNLLGECIDGAGNVGTGTINVVVDCETPLCEINSLVPDDADGNGCIDFGVNPGEASQTIDWTVTGLGSFTTDLFLDMGATPIASGGVDETSVAVTLSSPPWTTGSHTLTCVATDLISGLQTFPVTFTIPCVDDNTVDPAPTFAFPLCGFTFAASADTNPAMPGFQTNFTLQTCCVAWSLDVDCGAGVTTYSSPPGPADPSCALTPVTDVTLLEDTACTLTTSCLDDSDGATVTMATCPSMPGGPSFYVSSLPVLNIVSPTTGSTFGISADEDSIAPDLQTTITVTGTGLAGSDTVCIFEGPTQVAGPVTYPGDGMPMNFVVSLVDGVHTLVADVCAGGPVTISTVTVTVDTVPPLPPTGLTCVYVDVRAGQVSCSYTVPATGGVVQVRLHWGRDSSTFTYTAFSGATTFPDTGGMAMHTFGGPRIGDDVAVAVATVDAAGNESTPSATVVVGPLLPSVSVFTEGATAGDHFGTIVSAAGDMNGDGVDDIAISADGYPAGAFDGRVYIWFGSSGANLDSLLNGSPDVIIDETDASFGFLGTGMVGGDFNGDGCGDLALALPGWSRVHIILGAGNPALCPGTIPTSLSLTTGLRIEEPSALGGFSFFGYGEFSQSALASGDVNGDGITDLIIGADDYPTIAGTHLGRAYVILGQTNAARVADSRWVAGLRSADDADAIIEGSAGDSLGSSVAYLGPIVPGSVTTPTMGRGIGVGAPRYMPPGNNVGYAAAFAWPLPAPPTIATPTADAVAVYTDSTTGNFGTTVAGTGDFWGTSAGLGGLAAGGREISSGVVYLFLNSGAGLSDGSTAAPSATLASGAGFSMGDDFGMGFAGGYITAGVFAGTVASFDGDPYPDLVGADSVGTFADRVYGLYGGLGTAAAPPYDFALPGPGTGLTYEPNYSVNYVGDLNDDGYLDLAAGFPGTGGDVGAVVIYY
jgi:hypothetical protein